MRFYLHFTYDRWDGNGQLWYSCTLKAKDKADARDKADRAMSGFKNAQLTELTEVL